MSKRKIGILTSGGDCQGLNAAIRGVGKALLKEFDDDVTIYGIENGYKGLIEGNWRELTNRDFSGILSQGGTILGTSRQPFKVISKDENKIAAMKENYKKLGLDCLTVLGGNGTHKTANLLANEGLNVVTLPKTIDNDIWNTDITFGFQSAVEVAAGALDCIHTTARSHDRVFVVEVMGHKVGWLTLFAGIAGSADAILLPEIPYDVASIAELVNKRDQKGKHFTIVAVAEGAISVEDAQLTKKERKKKFAADKFPSAAYRFADALSKVTNREIRVTVPGHMQRGGAPCPMDRVLSTRFGAAAANFIKEECYGYMTAMKNGHIVPVALEDVAGKLKTVPLDSEVIAAARDLEVYFGDEK